MRIQGGIFLTVWGIWASLCLALHGLKQALSLRMSEAVGMDLHRIHMGKPIASTWLLKVKSAQVLWCSVEMLPNPFRIRCFKGLNPITANRNCVSKSARSWQYRDISKCKVKFWPCQKCHHEDSWWKATTFCHWEVWGAHEQGRTRELRVDRRYETQVRWNSSRSLEEQKEFPSLI